MLMASEILCSEECEYETVLEEKCVTEKTKACEKFWKEDGYGGKVWTEDPSKCHWLESDSCHDEPRPKKVGQSYV